MSELFFPTSPGGPGGNVGQDLFVSVLGPMVRGADGVNGTPGIGNPLLPYGNNGGRQVSVHPGDALIRGGAYHLTQNAGADLIVNLTANSSGATRYDLVVIRHDPALGTDAGGQAHIIAIPGTPGAGVPAATRIVGGIWDIPLAVVTCIAGYTTINASDVADARQFLPPSFVYADSRGAMPPVNGSQGRLVWDLNPANALRPLYYTNGATWLPVIYNPPAALPAPQGPYGFELYNFTDYGGVRAKARYTIDPYGKVSVTGFVRAAAGWSAGLQIVADDTLPEPLDDLWQTFVGWNNQRNAPVRLDLTDVGGLIIQTPGLTADTITLSFTYQTTSALYHP